MTFSKRAPLVGAIVAPITRAAVWTIFFTPPNLRVDVAQGNLQASRPADRKHRLLVGKTVINK